MRWVATPPQTLECRTTRFLRSIKVFQQQSPVTLFLLVVGFVCCQLFAQSHLPLLSVTPYNPHRLRYHETIPRTKGLRMYKLVATDMDETFLGHDHKVPQANIDAILRMRELGVLFVPASGRAYGSIMNSLRDLPPACLEGSYVISYNGGCINRVGVDEPIISNRIPFEAVKRLFDYAVYAGDIGMHIYTVAGDTWGWNLTPTELSYLEGHIDTTLFEGDSIEFLRDVPLSKCLYVYEDLNLLHELSWAMDPELTEGLSTTFSSGRYYEFNPSGVDKGSGLRQLSEMLGIDIADTIACGDSANDMAMLEAAGVGVVVSNASDDALAIADYRARSSCDDGVFAEVLEKFIEPEHK